MPLLHVTHLEVTFREHILGWKCACIQTQLFSPLRRPGEKKWGRKRRKWWTGVSPSYTWVKLVARRLAQQIETGFRQTGGTTADSPCTLPFQTQQPRLRHHAVQLTYSTAAAAAVVSSLRRPPFSVTNR